MTTEGTAAGRPVSGSAWARSAFSGGWDKRGDTRWLYAVFFLLTMAQSLPLTAIQPLTETKRWMPISTDLLTKTFHYTHYAWVTPSEFLGDHIFTPSGGFAYLHRDDVCTTHRPIEKLGLKWHVMSKGEKPDRAHHCFLSSHSCQEDEPTASRGTWLSRG